MYALTSGEIAQGDHLLTATGKVMPGNSWLKCASDCILTYLVIKSFERCGILNNISTFKDKLVAKLGYTPYLRACGIWYLDKFNRGKV